MGLWLRAFGGTPASLKSLTLLIFINDYSYHLSFTTIRLGYHILVFSLLLASVTLCNYWTYLQPCFRLSFITPDGDNINSFHPRPKCCQILSKSNWLQFVLPFDNPFHLPCIFCSILLHRIYQSIHPNQLIFSIILSPPLEPLILPIFFYDSDSGAIF